MSSFDLSELEKYNQTLKSEAPSLIHKVKKSSLLDIGKYDITTFRATGLSRLNIRSKGAKYAFKYHLANNDNTLSEFSRWKSAGILERGGTIRARGKYLFVPTLAGLKRNGKKKYSPAQITAEMQAGKMSVITPKGRSPLLVRHVGRQNKAGNWSKGARLEIIAVLKRSIRHKGGWFSLAGNFQKNQAQHETIWKKNLELIDNSGLSDKGVK